MTDFIIGDYKYTRLGDPNTVLVGVVDNSKSSYDDIPSSVTYGGVEYSVISMYLCFAYCTSLTQAPVIPDSVTDMRECFLGCTSLTQAPAIPSSVTSMARCFEGCTSLTQAPAIPSSVTSMARCFEGCTSLVGDIYIYYLDTRPQVSAGCFYGTTQPITLHAMNNNTETCDLLAATASNSNVYVNVRPETPITYNDTQMNYMTNVGLTPLSLQTNANLVQCEIPDLVNGGTIITNVNDALVDLINRMPYSIAWELDDGESATNYGVTILRRGDTIGVSGSAGGMPLGYQGVLYMICKYTIIHGGDYQIVGVPSSGIVNYRRNAPSVSRPCYGDTSVGSLLRGETISLYVVINRDTTYNDIFTPRLIRTGGG